MDNTKWEYHCACGKKHTFAREQVEQEINCRCGRPIDWLELRLPPPERPISMALPPARFKFPWPEPRITALIAALLMLFVIAIFQVDWDRPPANGDLEPSAPVAAKPITAKPPQEPADPLEDEIAVFVDSFPELKIGTIWGIHKVDRWREGEKRIVETWDADYDFYFVGDEVVSVWIRGTTQRSRRLIFAR